MRKKRSSMPSRPVLQMRFRTTNVPDSTLPPLRSAASSSSFPASLPAGPVARTGRHGCWTRGDSIGANSRHGREVPELGQFVFSQYMAIQLEVWL